MDRQHDKAAHVYKGLHQAYPTNVHYLYNLGETYFAMGNHNDALSTFVKVKELPGAIPQTHLRIAACHQAMGNNNYAKQYLDMLMKAEAPDWFKKNNAGTNKRSK